MSNKVSKVSWDEDGCGELRGRKHQNGSILDEKDIVWNSGWPWRYPSCHLLCQQFCPNAILGDSLKDIQNDRKHHVPYKMIQNETGHEEEALSLILFQEQILRYFYISFESLRYPSDFINPECRVKPSTKWTTIPLNLLLLVVQVLRLNWLLWIASAHLTKGYGIMGPNEKMNSLSSFR